MGVPRPMPRWSASASPRITAAIPGLVGSRGKDRLGVAAARVEVVSEAGDAHWSSHSLDPGLECRPDVCRIVDPRGDLSQLPPRSQLVEHRWRDAEPRSQPVNSGRGRPGRSQSLHEPIDALGHLRFQRRGDARQSDPPAVACQPTVIGHFLDHPTKLRVLQYQWRGSPVPGRWLPAGGGADARD
jgi:hypothetical protein